MRKVLIISKYFPPCGIALSHRIGKFVKYLPHFDWQPVVLTVSTRSYLKESVPLDNFLVNEISDITKIIRVPYISLFRLTKWSHPVEIDRNVSIWRSFKELIRKIGSLIMNPDRDILWIPFVILYGLRFAKKANVIFAICQPYSDLVAGVILSKITGKPLVVDFADLWMSKLHTFWYTNLQKRIQAFQERKVVELADKITVLSEFPREDILKRYKTIFPKKIVVLHQGYDEADFKEIRKSSSAKKFIITHTGTISNCDQYRGIMSFLKAIKELISDKKDLNRRIIIELVGNIDEWGKSLVKRLELEEVVEINGHVPHYEVINYLNRADALLLLLGTTKRSFDIIIPRKLYEYAAARKPIIALVPENGEAAKIIRDNNWGIVCNPERQEEIISAIMKLYHSRDIFISEHTLPEKFKIKNITMELSEIFNDLCNTERRHIDRNE